MLTSIHIENYALIQQTDILFDNGFVVITGETGAGKSIILGALGLLLGQRADLQALGDKERKCVVEAQFDISGLGLQPLFEQLELDYDDQLLLRRELMPSGKSRAFVNDSPVQLPLLKNLGEHIIDIHSQHQTITLTGSLFQTQLLDNLGNNASTLSLYKTAHAEYTRLKRLLEQLTDQEARNRKEQDYMQFLFDELSEARLQADEQSDLEEEASLLNNTESIKEAFGTIAALCDNEEDGAIARLIAARNQLSHIAGYHKELPQLEQRLDSSIIELRDLLSELENIDQRLNYSPERQQEVNSRLDLIYRLQKKHAVASVEELLSIQQNLAEQLHSMGSIGDQISQTMEAVDHAYKQMQQFAEQLTASRSRAARQLEEQVVPTLALLGMKESRLQVSITPSGEYGPMGHDNIVFLFNANRGGELRELAKVASGGELSRLMLAIKSINCNSQHHPTPTIIFDEIDTGVSGDISIAVGDMMKRMTETTQVIAITHLPQIAAKASQHFKVSKHVDGHSDRTVSQMRQLSPDERTTEIAIMLSSNPPTLAALQTARELMETRG
ncbi:MAG: DNA repair protein RecN [Bacteroidales bacterium]|nr:DNA repair protein RecN [Bacteroidales bacterium]